MRKAWAHVGSGGEKELEWRRSQLMPWLVSGRLVPFKDWLETERAREQDAFIEATPIDFGLYIIDIIFWFWIFAFWCFCF